MAAPHASDLTPSPLPGARIGRDPERAIRRGPRRVPAEVVAATQRDRLFDGLVHTVAAKGYANARVSDICQAAGVTRPAFYALFAGKDDAFLAAYRHGTDVLLRMMEEAYAAATSWPAGCRAALRVLLEVLASVPAFATMAIVEIDSLGPAARLERDRLLRRFHQFFRAAPRHSEPAGSDDLVVSVVGGIYATIHRYVAAGRVGELPTLLPALTYFMIVPFLGREAAADQAAAADGDGVAAHAPCVSG
ncbi:transcriptional regulator, TetR family [Micromonospora pattaloongensis]|uniref:Transcriptional regulator, TetR family n=1 Tax=Micromonospora pattaloongensis TaxID=405436 RepID=A0A1H3NKY4_9ACTN|nr:TetR/AcrR family transcriptional regulator [Micromonospora pattaloongensis]SDY89464.1 transcriptional regulator, TetR family [Micromonospora pattaloongensis]